MSDRIKWEQVLVERWDVTSEVRSWRHTVDTLNDEFKLFWEMDYCFYVCIEQSDGFEDHVSLYSTCKIDSITFKAGKEGNLMGH